MLESFDFYHPEKKQLFRSKKIIPMITNHDYDNRNIFIISIDHNLKCESIIDQNRTDKRYDGFSR